MTGAPSSPTIPRVDKRVAWSLAFATVLAACGARTGLHVPPAEDAGPIVDAGPDADAPEDAPLDAPEDVFDAPPDKPVNNCKDAGITYVYLISTEDRLIRFYPPSASFTTIGTISCPSGPGAEPFSMAVDRDGIAYVLFNDGELFRVSTLTASCQATGFQGSQNGFPLLFGMGFSSNATDPGETLFVAGADTQNTGIPSELATIDPLTFTLAPIAHMSQFIGEPELTGTGDARLFAFAPGTPTSHLSEIDKASAAVLSDVHLDLNQATITAWAFAFWGGDFYFFTSDQPGHSVVHRYTPGGDPKPPVVATTNLTIVGAGVSTCAPSK